MLFASEVTESSLYRYFHEFYHEIIAIKAAPAECSRIQHQLMGVFERQRLDASQRGGEQHLQLYQEAQYLMVALTDEIFLHLLEWVGKDTWRTQLLEVKMFNSQIAGQRVFEKLKTLLNRRDPHTLELARLYLIVLFLGFQGKYRNTTDPQQLQEYENYRRQLYFFITQKNVDELYDRLHYQVNQRIFPEAYHVVELKPQERHWLPSLWWWQVSFLALLVGLLLVSFGLWHQVTHDLNTQTETILEQHASP
jgi:type VI secretion system protein ImpK